MVKSFKLDTACDWALEDLMRIGTKIEMFAADHFNDPRMQNELRDRLSRTIHEFEEDTGLCIL